MIHEIVTAGKYKRGSREKHHRDSIVINQTHDHHGTGCIYW
jgi:hypothetical protein